MMTTTITTAATTAETETRKIFLEAAIARGFSQNEAAKLVDRIYKLMETDYNKAYKLVMTRIYS